MFVKQALLDEEQRRGRISDPDAALRSDRRFGNKKWKNSTKHKPKSTKGHHQAKRAGE